VHKIKYFLSISKITQIVKHNKASNVAKTFPKKFRRNQKRTL